MSDAPDKTLFLRKKEFEKRRLKKDKQKRQFALQERIARLSHPDFIQPMNTNIQSLFPLDKSNPRVLQRQDVVRNGERATTVVEE
jgi:hypothetical protein